MNSVSYLSMMSDSQSEKESETLDAKNIREELEDKKSG